MNRQLVWKLASIWLLKSRLASAATFTMFSVLCLFLGAARVSSAQNELDSTDGIKFTTLFNFDGASGDGPTGTFVQGIDGNFYGSAGGGGAHGDGTIFKITPSGRLTTLHSFNGTDGYIPVAGVVLSTDGNFYGTTLFGGVSTSCGTSGCGTVFRISPGGKLTTLHNFNGADGNYPGPLIQGTDGNFYGTTGGGGADGDGTVFRITPAGALKTLYSFCSQTGCADGSSPDSNMALIQGSDGNFYGTTFFGGASTSCGTAGCGTVFKITATGTLTTLVSFDLTNGSGPAGGLIQATDGNFYGTTEGGGTGSACLTFVCGTVFRLTPQGTLTMLHSFSYFHSQNGLQPSAPVIQATDGNFYGTTAQGGTNGDGTVFKITPSGAFTLLHSFDGTDGEGIFAALLQGTNGTFYAPTYLGGPSSGCAGNSCGTVFSLAVGLGPLAETVPTAGKVGTAVKVLGNNLTGTTGVSFNSKPATFVVVSSTLIKTTVPVGATSGFVMVHTPSGALKSNVKFRVLP